MKSSNFDEKEQLWVKQLDKYNHIIWDWNGTVIDDVHVAVAAVNVLLIENNLQALTVEEYRRVFCFPIKSYYQKIGFDFNSVSFEKLCDRFVSEYNHHRAFDAKLFIGTLELLKQFSSQKTQSILSAGSQGHLDQITKHYGVHHLFDHVFGIDNNFAESKLQRGKELLNASKVPFNETVLIGDTDHDLEVGQKLGIDVLLIADGHQSFERLSQIHHNVLESRYR